jgi:hypothetical protein
MIAAIDLIVQSQLTVAGSQGVPPSLPLPSYCEVCHSIVTRAIGANSPIGVGRVKIA